MIIVLPHTAATGNIWRIPTIHTSHARSDLELTQRGIIAGKLNGAILNSINKSMQSVCDTAELTLRSHPTGLDNYECPCLSLRYASFHRFAGRSLNSKIRPLANHAELTLRHRIQFCLVLWRCSRQFFARKSDFSKENEHSSTDHILANESLIAKHHLLSLKDSRLRPGTKRLFGILHSFVHFSLSGFRD